MSRFTSYLTAAAVVATFSLPSLAHAKGNNSHSSHSSQSKSSSQCSSQNSSCKHGCDHGDKCGNSDSGTQFSPGGVPFGQGPTGIPSNPGTVTPGNKFAGLAGQNFKVDTAGSYNRVNAQMGQNFQVNKDGSYNRENALMGQNVKRKVTATVTGTVSRETSDWGALGEALDGLGSALNDLVPLDAGFHGPAIPQK